MTGHCQSTPV